MTIQGNPVWYELMTPDPDAAAKFYAAVVGWKFRDSGQTAMEYRFLSTPDGDVGGMMKRPDGGPVAGWYGYVGVDDLDASLTALTAAGGKIEMPPTEVPGAGRFAMVSDPQGILLYFMQPASGQSSNSYAPMLDGHCSWNELSTRDQAGALEFYNGLFGWTAGDAMDMGPMGKYQFISQGERGLGAMMTAPPGTRPAWTYYFRVADVDAAAAATVKAGGRIDHGPSEVPGGDHIIQGTDPQGAMFALVGKRGSA